MHVVWAFLLSVGAHHLSCFAGVGAMVFGGLLVPAAVPRASGG